MSKKIESEDIFKIAGVRRDEVEKWQKQKSLDHLPPKAALQIYSKVVLKKSIKQPYPIYTVEKLWERINGINAGTEDRPSSGKLFVGIKDVTVIGLSNAIRYKGCPKCLKGQRTIGANYCSGHGTDLVPLEDLQWSEWLVYGDQDEFVVKMNPSYTDRYNEINMTGAVIWVEGMVNLDEDPVLMMASMVRQFKSGNLMLGSLDDDESDIGDGDDFTAGRDEVALSGFDDDEKEKGKPDPIVMIPVKEEKNPFLVDEPGNGISDEFKHALRTEFNDMLLKWAVNPVKKGQVERYMLDWIEQEYPREFSEEKEAKEKFWDIVDGMYLAIGDDRVQMTPKSE